MWFFFFTCDFFPIFSYDSFFTCDFSWFIFIFSLDSFILIWFMFHIRFFPRFSSFYMIPFSRVFFPHGSFVYTIFIFPAGTRFSRDVFHMTHLLYTHKIHLSCYFFHLSHFFSYDSFFACDIFFIYFHNSFFMWFLSPYFLHLFIQDSFFPSWFIPFMWSPPPKWFTCFQMIHFLICDFCHPIHLLPHDYSYFVPLDDSFIFTD